MDNNGERPDAHEVEITVLGRGCGESIVIHAGDGAWVVIDSFRDNQSGEPAPLVYLKSIGVDIAEDVTAVVLTHLHADHYRGIYDVVRTCRAAWFYLPGVLPTERWEDILKRAADLPEDEIRGAGRVAQAALIARGREKLRSVGPDSEIQTRREGAIRCVGPTSTAMTSQVVTANPSDAEVRKLFKNLNFTSTVLWLRIDGIRALFGADLDEHDKALGWSALMEEQRGKPWIRGASFENSQGEIAGASSARRCPVAVADRARSQSLGALAGYAACAKEGWGLTFVGSWCWPNHRLMSAPVRL